MLKIGFMRKFALLWAAKRRQHLSVEHTIVVVPRLSDDERAERAIPEDEQLQLIVACVAFNAS